MATNGLPNGGSEIVAVGEVRDALPAPDLSSLNLTVGSQTHAVGVIHPPPDIRAIVDKTAQFVAKNGAPRTVMLHCCAACCAAAASAISAAPCLLAPNRRCVFRAGVEFEKRIVANERDNVKFNFLKSTDPYHKYYRSRVSSCALSSWLYSHVVLPVYILYVASTQQAVVTRATGTSAG